MKYEVVLWCTEHKSLVAKIARVFGGSFNESLAEALQRADVVNTQRLLLAFPEIFKDIYDKRTALPETTKR